jgi:hypothetical protein
MKYSMVAPCSRRGQEDLPPPLLFDTGTPSQRDRQRNEIGKGEAKLLSLQTTPRLFTMQIF